MGTGDSAASDKQCLQQCYGLLCPGDQAGILSTSGETLAFICLEVVIVRSHTHPVFDLRTLAIGRIYDSSILGYYNRGESIPKVVVSNLDGSIQAVMFSAFRHIRTTPES